MKTAKVYPLMVDTRLAPSMAEVMLADMSRGVIDAAVLWGPMAGYYAGKSGLDLAVVPLVGEGGSRMTHRITMGVRPADQEWKRALNTLIRDKQQEINRILLDYGVPLLDENDQPILE
jgi:hypothetical protein